MSRGRSDPSTSKPNLDLRAFAYEVCDWDTELYRDEIAATLLFAAARIDAAEAALRTDAPYSFWLGREGKPV